MGSYIPTIEPLSPVRVPSTRQPSPMRIPSQPLSPVRVPSQRQPSPQSEEQEPPVVEEQEPPVVEEQEPPVVEETPEEVPTEPVVEETPEEVSITVEETPDEVPVVEETPTEVPTDPVVEETSEEVPTEKRKKKRKRKRKSRIKTYKSSVPPYLGPVLYVPETPDYDSMSMQEQVQWREDFRIKFGLLRRNFGTCDIPDLDPDESLEMIHARYDRYIRSIHISNAADSYRNYLILYFLFLELVATQALGLPASGFTLAQLTGMSRYEYLLIELGEKWYVPGGSDWPVEYRILFLSLFNMVIFIAIKWFGRIVGDRAAETLINTIIGGVVNNSEPNPDAAHEDNGFDLGSLISAITGMMGNNGNTVAGGASDAEDGGRRRRGPQYTE